MLGRIALVVVIIALAITFGSIVLAILITIGGMLISSE